MEIKWIDMGVTKYSYGNYSYNTCKYVWNGLSFGGKHHN